MYMMRVSSFFPSTVINGEKASYCTPTFSEKRNRTLSLLLKDVEHRCTTEVGSATLTTCRCQCALYACVVIPVLLTSPT